MVITYRKFKDHLSRLPILLVSAEQDRENDFFPVSDLIGGEGKMKK